ncbi:MAG: FGGY-family carbohydrate kinase [Clostridia bacterium]
MAVIGLDVGTSGVKSTVFEGDARVVAHAYREYDLISEGEGLYELDPRVLLDSALAVLEESSRGLGTRIQAISVTSFGESFVCLDAQDRVLANTMIYMDKRGKEACDEYLKIKSAREIFCECGQGVEPMFALYKLRWMKENKPEILEKTRKICFIADFITHMLGGAHKCDYSLAARSAMFQVFQKAWIPDAIAFAGIDPAILPEPVPGASVVGGMSAEMAKRLGMTPGVKLIVGGHDQIMAALGSGAWEAGDVANGMGTVDCITSVMRADTLDMDKLLKYNFPVVPFLANDTYVTYAFNMSGGCAVKWFRDTLAQDIAGMPDAYRRLNQEAPDQPTDLYVLPYLAGGGTPYMDAATPGAVIGLRLGTSRGKLFRAFLEGESYEMRLNLECLEAAGIDVRRVITVGGGSNSPLWMQIRADVFGRNIYLPQNKEAGTLATALIGYVGLGKYPSIAAAQADMIAYAEQFVPDQKNQARYDARYKKYRRLYEGVKALYQGE